jgi:two-component system CheB/CheR fusion protein
MTKKVKSSKVSDSLFIVGIGASAGGLEAIHELFDNMPNDTGFAFVIIQHLSPDHKSLMPELLAKHSDMQIFEATDGTVVKENCIYLNPNKSFVTIKDGKLQLTDKSKSTAPNTAIDTFFNSLASDQGNKAIAIILSGTGTDGTNGLEAIKANGGLVIVQDPLSAKFDGMPNSAVATGFADIILSPDMIPAELADMLSETPLQRSFQEMNVKDEYTLREILDKVHKATNVDFNHYKRPTIQRRLEKRMIVKGLKSLKEYLAYLNNYPEEARLLTREFLIGVTKFFRDSDAFMELKVQVLPQLFQAKKPGEPIKIWIVACSTGEEAYSLAILIHEFLEEMKMVDAGIKIFATDINDEALEIAGKGVYSEVDLKDLSKDRRNKYFIREGNKYRIAPIIRKMVVFAHHNVLKDPPFSRVDLLCCRNMLIYMGPELQKNILRTIHFSLNHGGYLLLGPSENVGALKDSMKEISRKWKIYKSIGKSHLISHESFSPQPETKYNPFQQVIKTRNAMNHIPEIFRDTLIEEYNFAGIYIDKEFEVKQAIGSFKDYLRFNDGQFNLNLLKLVAPDLSVALSRGVRLAIKENERIVLKKVKLTDAGTKRIVDLIIKPYLSQSEYIQPFLFIVITPVTVEETKDKPAISDGDQHFDKTQLLLEVEHELKETKENLQAAIEELETANEELQSSNEEMISANEELQSTNEELQSLNEELHTVNSEHQLKIKELQELNDDLNNYFSSSDIGQLLVDKHLIIRKFSPAIKNQINLMDADIGRSITDISDNFQQLDFVRAIKNVMRNGQTAEKEILLRSNRMFIMRISPYVRLDKSIDGVVISFIDITHVRELGGIIESVFNISPSGITSKKAVRNKYNKIVDFEYTAVNKTAAAILGAAPEDLIGRRITKEFGQTPATTFSRYVDVVESGRTEHFEIYHDETERWYDVIATKMMDGVVTTFTDVTDKKRSQDLITKHYEELKQASNILSHTNIELEQSNYDLLQFASVVSHDLKEPLRKIQTFGNMLQLDTEAKLSTKEANYLEKMIKAAERMRRLIDDLLSFSKLSNKSVYRINTNLSDVIKQITDDLEIQIREQEAEIRVGDLPVVSSVSGQMHQLFQNLISNSLKFVKDRRPVIEINEIEMPEDLIKEFKISAKEYHCIEVRDNGIGFDEQYKEKIFGLFQRLTSEVVKPGTGIGLAICKRIVENHEGFISARSEVGKGSTFRIILPKKTKEKRNLKMEN